MAEKEKRVNEEKECIKFVNKKVVEKCEVHRKAVEEYNCARNVLLSVRADCSSLNSPNQKTFQNPFLVIC